MRTPHHTYSMRRVAITLFSLKTSCYPRSLLGTGASGTGRTFMQAFARDTADSVKSCGTVDAFQMKR